MSEEKEAFLSRWSRLKREAEVAPATPLPTTQSTPPATTEGAPAADAAAELPPIDSINLETDIGPYLQAKVDEGLKRMALKKLFHDPHFHFDNMDKLDTYIDDYSIADPLPDSWLKELKFAQDYIFKDPTKPEVPAESKEAAAKVETGAAVTAATDADAARTMPPAAGDHTSSVEEKKSQPTSGSDSQAK